VTSLTTRPSPALRPFVSLLWAVDGSDAPRAGGGGGLERVLPTGLMHLVVRLSPSPLTLFDDELGNGRRTVGHALVGGARSAFYVRDVSAPSRSVGAQLRPGAAPHLLGVPASALAERHTCLEDLWGAGASRLRDQLDAAPSLEAALGCFEAALVARVRCPPVLHPAVAEALASFEGDPSVTIAEVVERTGTSHRRFIQLFRDAVGLAPKQFGRVARFQRALDTLRRAPEGGLASVALDLGYADQAHLTREFRALGGLSPTAWRALGSPSNHVAIPEAVRGQIPSRRPAARGSRLGP
jgi:AraC-like DNA-binding protein